MRTLQRGLHLFAIQDLPQETWRNGGGVARTLVRSGVDGQTHWRISIADIVRDGPFSVFAGLQRQAVLLQGSGVILQGAETSWRLERLGAWAAFSGDLPLQAVLHGSENASPGARLWNVMSDPRHVATTVDVTRHRLRTVDALAHGALCVLEGTAEVLVGGALIASLGPGAGLLFEGWPGTFSVRFHPGPAYWLMTKVEKR
ncbi:HutD family protein [Rhodoferax sp. WC2427]|uniref:HutD/Ves family protein n=1 Tax=Rhodoferax sp. WC2427 TaxID=3234144 RepID=UPI003466A9D4